MRKRNLMFRTMASLISCTPLGLRRKCPPWAWRQLTKVATLGMEAAAAALKQIKAIVSMLKTKQAGAASFLSKSQEASLPTVNVIVDAETEFDVSDNGIADQLHAARLATKVSTLGMETAAALEQIKVIVSMLKTKKAGAASFLSKSHEASLPTVNVVVDAETEFDGSRNGIADQLHAARLSTKVATLGMEAAAALKQIKAIVSMLKTKQAGAASFLSKSQDFRQCRPCRPST
eukprot:TRINITY_DN6830_c0_g1_i8.p1 TRINITY_DN6830_c0_g1~~TRINITY_DN6830_c0_g1_i8.p1  ORF type:complete len:233 (-),score=62.95 TRINITY_DN6830_c0_g1_i8:79-777(-)